MALNRRGFFAALAGTAVVCSASRAVAAPLAVVTVARATQPHLPSLAAALAPLLAAAGPQSFNLRYQGGFVFIERLTFAGVNMTSVNAAVAAAPVDTPQLGAQDDVDSMTIFQKAIVLSTIDAINTLRTQPTTTFAAITVPQALAAVRAKAATL